MADLLMFMLMAVYCEISLYVLVLHGGDLKTICGRILLLRYRCFHPFSFPSCCSF